MGIYSLIVTLLLGANIALATSPPVEEAPKKDRQKEFKYWVSKLRLNYGEAIETKNEKKRKLAIKNMKKLLASEMDKDKKEIRAEIRALKDRLKEIDKNRKARLDQAEQILKANDAMMELEELDL